MRRALLVAGGSIGVLALVCGGATGYYLYTNNAEAAPTAAIGGSIALPADSSMTRSGQGIPLNASTGVAGSNSIAINSQNTAENSRQSSQDSSNNNNNTSANAALPTTPTLAELKSYQQYQDGKNAMFGELIMGTGPEAKAGSKVTINYRGWTTDGKLFDDSYQRGKTLGFTIGQHQVVLGMEEGVFGMKVGGKRRIIIPPAVGYGAQANGPIPPNSLLVFDVELVGSE